MPTYTLEEILTEKLCALMGRTEPRDLYDVYWLFEWGGFCDKEMGREGDKETPRLAPTRS